MGTVLAVAIVFVILFVATRSIGYYRGSFSVAGTETSSNGAGRPAAVGAGAGLLMVALLVLLYTGVTRWEWFGQPAPKASVAVTPAKESPAPGLGVAASPAPGGAVASPSASPAH